MCNVRPEDKISAQETKNKLKLNIMREYLPSRKLELYIHLKRMKCMLGLVNVEISRLVVVCPLGDRGVK